jgi:hypothetical protein
MGEELSKAQQDRARLRRLLTQFVKTIDVMEEHERMDKAMGKEHNKQADAFMTLMSLGILQTEVTAFGRVFIAEHQALFSDDAVGKTQ